MSAPTRSLNRKVTDEEYEEVVDYAIGLGGRAGIYSGGGRRQKRTSSSLRLTAKAYNA